MHREISNISTVFTIYSIYNIYAVCQQFCKLLLRRVSVAVLVARTSPVIMVTAGPGMLRDWARCVDNM